MTLVMLKNLFINLVENVDPNPELFGQVGGVLLSYQVRLGLLVGLASINTAQTQTQLSINWVEYVILAPEILVQVGLAGQLQIATHETELGVAGFLGVNEGNPIIYISNSIDSPGPA